MSEPVPAVEIRHLVKDFRTSFRRRPLRAVDDLSLTIRAGEVYGLIGPNGSGKSTTMKALLGLMAPTSGSCRIFGKDSLKVDSRDEVGFLPENPYFHKHLTGVETLRFYGRLCGLRGRALDDRVVELLDLVGLTDAGGRRLAGYSKGMLQRIGLAQALVQEPRLVILDEPTAGVDPVGSRGIRDLILALRDRGITVFLCSHLLEQVQEVCDHVGILCGGRIVREGRLDDLISIEDQTEIVIRRAGADLVERITALVGESPGASIVRSGRPRTTLERLFLETTTGKEGGA
ncbi:MAG: ABC transporter ATP-binding protein [Verrucomicrobia bacterium]|nr:ABC transporter ATP-binding protein [Verrucomicrobiota bacterium]